MLVEQGLNNSGLRTNPRQKCSKRMIKEAVASVEAGIRRQQVCEHYGISGYCLATWMRIYGSQDNHLRKNHSFTVQQKRSILLNIDQGTMTIRQAMSAYNITGQGTISGWRRQFKQENMALIATNPIVMEQLPTNPSDPKSIELEKALALALAKLKIAALETIVVKSNLNAHNVITLSSIHHFHYLLE
jgi:transposase